MKRIAMGVTGAFPSSSSEIGLRIVGGLVFMEIIDRNSGANTRRAQIAISPDKMVLLGKAMAAVGEGEALDDIDSAGFNIVSSSAEDEMNNDKQQLEPAAEELLKSGRLVSDAVSHIPPLYSIAISLKRIADVLEGSRLRRDFG